MESHRAADQPRSDEIAFQYLSGKKYHADHDDPCRLRPELEDGDADREHPASDGSHERDERNQTRDAPDYESELQADQRKGCCVNRSQNRADRDLASHEPRKHAVDLPEQSANCFGMVAGQHVVDLFDDLVPIGQHVDHHDGNDDHDHQYVYGAHRGRGHLIDDLAGLAAGRRPYGPDRRNDDRHVFFPAGDVLVQQRPDSLVDECLDVFRKFRNEFHEFHELIGEERYEQKPGNDDHEEGDERDHGRRKYPGQSGPLESVRQRIKQIGQRAADHERKQRVAQHPKAGEKYDGADAPPHGLLLYRQAHCIPPTRLAFKEVRAAKRIAMD